MKRYSLREVPGYLSLLASMVGQAKDDLQCNKRIQDTNFCLGKCSECRESAAEFLNPATSPLLDTGLFILRLVEERRREMEEYSRRQHKRASILVHQGSFSGKEGRAW